MIYVPNYQNTNCVVLSNSTTIRVYDIRPSANNSYYRYTDYYINSHYLFNTGTQYFSTQSSLPTCRTDVTSIFYYRTDIQDILLIFLIMSIFCFYLPFRLFTRFSRRTR